MELNLRELAINFTKSTGVLPAIKLNEERNLLPYIRAMYEGGARVIEVTMTTPGVLRAFDAASHEFQRNLLLAAGTVLDAPTARAALLAGAAILVSPAVIPEVIAVANRYGAACYVGAFTATECLTAMEAGASMIKIFPAALAGPRYMTNLKMVLPEINLIPSGGINLENTAEYIRCGASAVSGARNFFNPAEVDKHGLAWLTEQTTLYLKTVTEAKKTLYPLP